MQHISIARITAATAIVTSLVGSVSEARIDTRLHNNSNETRDRRKLVIIIIILAEICETTATSPTLGHIN
jgi:uncharacterized membrane protein